MSFLSQINKLYALGTGEPDGDYDRVLYDAVADAIHRKTGHRVTHEEFDKYQGVVIKIRLDHGFVDHKVPARRPKDEVWLFTADFHEYDDFIELYLWIEGTDPDEQIPVKVKHLGGDRWEADVSDLLPDLREFIENSIFNKKVKDRKHLTLVKSEFAQKLLAKYKLESQ